jgi:hypothetical protein
MISFRQTFEQISNKIFAVLVKTFPVSCASDEFYFFPHIADPGITSIPWDDFSTESIGGIINEISDILHKLNQLSLPGDDINELADMNMLVLFLHNLRDQMDDLALWKKQPSLYLTIMNAGLAQAVNQDNKKLLHQRLNKIPEFLGQASQNIQEVPHYWKEISLEMINDCKHFIELLSADKRDTELSLKAIKALEDKIRKMHCETELNIPSELLERIYSGHLASGLKIFQISEIIEDEISEMFQVMIEEAEKILKKTVKHLTGPEELINEVYEKISLKPDMHKDPVDLYRNEINQIRAHLIGYGLMESDQEKQVPVNVEGMPQYFRAIRSASSYSIYPKYPPEQGTFFVMTSTGYGVPAENLGEFRMLTAHETFPGHHLLDSSRLSLKNIVRRSLEFPLFYEGWASFAEVLLSYTGYFTDPADRFILAKRRYWRAVRGRADIGLQTKKLDIDSAANILQVAGIPYKRALASVKIYTLNPGYQTCYTVGIRRFLDLYNQFGKADPGKFVRTVLNNGEVLFPDLENLMNSPHT